MTRGTPKADPEAVAPDAVGAIGRRSARHCLWCGREVADGATVGRKRRYCGQSCRQRAYESRAVLDRGGLPPDAVVLTVEERESLADRLFQVRCAAEDVSTAVQEGAAADELGPLLADLMAAAKAAEVFR